ncbi:regulator of microtubule dynamics protein 1-like [Bradysia coprophila]|uniref:regulator of microtubule dynamics protein 1-like n=1 Tax=Bradysia coprophila TaxID=38358 RepID=UPI00187DC0E3|nr:regulator of microtubule dynamics protein 1-like [Bradysia coprophila]
MTNEELENWKIENDNCAKDISFDKEILLEKTRDGFKKFNGDEDVELLWRIARAVFLAGCLAERKKDKETQKKLLFEAEEWCNKAIEKNPNCFEAHKWMAMILGKVADFVSTKERIEKGKDVKKHLELAIGLQPDEAYLYHVYGRWCFEVAKLSWVERNIAKLVFGTPPEATNDDALRNFKKGEELKENWKINYFYIAKTLIELKKYKEAVEYLDKAMKLPNEVDEDYIVSDELVELEKKYAKYR